ncbi:MAG: cytochrome-c peroxidase [Pseudomonadota bacterium]|nr:cytochrome-c peroxidase [Pseudomonadota bacterium]
MKKSIWVCAPCVTATVFLACTVGAGPTLAAENATGPHGAMAMQAQEQRLDKLVTRYTSPPAGIDPVAWASIYMMSGNELTPDRIALGRKLYFDTRLSKDGTLACATCHDVSHGFSDHRSVSEGIGDHLGKRSAPTTMNAALMQSQFWDGRAPSLEEQAKLPILNPIEMGHSDADSAMASIKTDSTYGAMFQKAYGRAPNYDDLGRAIASFERTVIFIDAPFDRFVAGDLKAMSPAAQRGLDLFNNKARCVSCHMINSSNPLGTDNLFHNIGVSARTKNFPHQEFRGTRRASSQCTEQEQ